MQKDQCHRTCVPVLGDKEKQLRFIRQMRVNQISRRKKKIQRLENAWSNKYSAIHGKKSRGVVEILSFNEPLEPCYQNIC